MTERLHFHFSLSCIGEGNGNPLQCSCLENPRDRGAWWAAIHGVTQSRTRLKWLSSSSSSVSLMLNVTCSVISDSLQPHDYSPPGSFVHGAFQARILEWVSIPFARLSSRLRDQLGSSHPGLLHCRQILYPFESLGYCNQLAVKFLGYRQSKLTWFDKSIIINISYLKIFYRSLFLIFSGYELSKFINTRSSIWCLH